MAWTVEYLASVQKDIKKFDGLAKKRIRNFIENRLATSNNPREMGHALKGSVYWVNFGGIGLATIVYYVRLLITR